MIKFSPKINVTLKNAVKNHCQRNATKKVDLSMEDFGYYKIGDQFIKTKFTR